MSYAAMKTFQFIWSYDFFRMVLQHHIQSINDEMKLGGGQWGSVIIWQSDVKWTKCYWSGLKFYNSNNFSEVIWFWPVKIAEVGRWPPKEIFWKYTIININMDKRVMIFSLKTQSFHSTKLTKSSRLPDSRPFFSPQKETHLKQPQLFQVLSSC